VQDIVTRTTTILVHHLKATNPALFAEVVRLSRDVTAWPDARTAGELTRCGLGDGGQLRHDVRAVVLDLLANNKI